MQLSPSSKVRDLGDQYLTFHDHISGICKSTHFHLRGIGRIRNLLTFDATAQLNHALITSCLDFCNSILYNLPNKQIERLQRIQNQAAHMLKRIPRRNHITPVLRELHWLRIHDRIICKILLLTHKAVNNTAPEYLCDLIGLNVKRTTIRTRASFDPGLLCVPPISKTCANSFFDRSFVYAAPTLWNALDLDIRLLPFFQSAYRAGHSCETALLRVYNDIVTTVGKGNGSFLVLLDLSAAFDTIDHDNLFYILEKYVGIGGSALRLIRSYFSDRTQRVQIDGIMSDFASLLCGVPQGSVLGPMKFCLYLLPLGTILRHHNIGYHIYADDTQLYISFKCKDPLESLTKLNMCISDIRVWMIKNKLKMNDSKTEFIIFRSPLLKQNLSDVSVRVGDMQVSPSSKVRHLGVVFDQYLTFHDHISGICKSTHFHLRDIGRIRNLLTFDATAQLIHALITSRLDFCNNILYNLPNK